MGRLSDDRRHVLRQRDLMPAFIERKEALMEGGLSLQKAQEQAFSEIAKENDLDLTVIEGLDGKPVVHRLKSERVPRSVFGNKSCSVSESISWAVDNQIIRDVSAKDAPSSAAYGLLTWARKTPLAMLELHKIYGRLAKAEPAAEADRPFHYVKGQEVVIPDYLKSPEELAEARA